MAEKRRVNTALPLLIGLMGARGAGKTSTAKAICDRYANFVRFSFAEPVRTETFQLIKAESLRDPMVAKWLHAVGDPFAHKTKDTPIWGMEVTPRDLLIEVGENARRQDPTYWIRKIRQQIAETTAHVVIDSMGHGDVLDDRLFRLSAGAGAASSRRSAAAVRAVRWWPSPRG
jgi:hypothetical protein